MAHPFKCHTASTSFFRKNDTLTPHFARPLGTPKKVTGKRVERFTGNWKIVLTRFGVRFGVFWVSVMSPFLAHP